jgi:CRP-like cAMP-binding protein
MMSLYTGQNQAHIDQSVRNFKRRSHLPKNHHTIWQIRSGFILSYTYLEDGTVVALGLWGPGDKIGTIFSKVEPYDMECLTDVELFIGIENDENQLTETLFNHLQQAQELMIIRAHKRVETVLFKLLAWLSKKFGSEVNSDNLSGSLIDMRLTHEDLAALVGSTRVTITRILGQLEQEGLINRLSLNRIIVKEEETWYYEI